MDRPEAAGVPESRLSFRHFWPRYLEAHRHPGTRAAHYLATVIGLGSAILSALLADPLFILIGIPLGYAIALSAHRWIERHPSLIGVNAVMGARADLLMCWLGLTGQLLDEYRRLGLRAPRSYLVPRRSVVQPR